MVEIGVSFGAGLLMAGFALMLLWGLLWLAVGMIGWARDTCPVAILLSSVSSSTLAGLSIAGLWWSLNPARLNSPIFYLGAAGIPVALIVTGFCRLQDGRRIGPAFVEGSRAMLHQLLGLGHHQKGCGHCQEQPGQEQPGNDQA